MRNWNVRIRVAVEAWMYVEAETEEDAKREALIFADGDNLNDWKTVSADVYEVDEVKE